MALGLNTKMILLRFMLLAAIISPTLVYAASGTAGLTSQLCALVTDVRTVIGVFALVLFIVGGTLYAVAHVMPAAGNLRGNLQGWSLGMIVGSIVGLILVIAAPWIVNTVVGFGGSNLSAASTALSGC